MSIAIANSESLQTGMRFFLSLGPSSSIGIGVSLIVTEWHNKKSHTCFEKKKKGLLMVFQIENLRSFVVNSCLKMFWWCIKQQLGCQAICRRQLHFCLNCCSECMFDIGQRKHTMTHRQTHDRCVQTTCVYHWSLSSILSLQIDETPSLIPLGKGLSNQHEFVPDSNCILEL